MIFTVQRCGFSPVWRRRWTTNIYWALNGFSSRAQSFHWQMKLFLLEPTWSLFKCCGTKENSINSNMRISSNNHTFSTRDLFEILNIKSRFPTVLWLFKEKKRSKNFFYSRGCGMDYLIILIFRSDYFVLSLCINRKSTCFSYYETTKVKKIGTFYNVSVKIVKR